MPSIRIFHSVFLALFLLFMSGAAHAQGSSQVNWQTRGAKDIAPGYLIRLTCVDDKELNGDFRVDFDGGISLPYGVRVDTTGMTISDLNSRLRSEYRRFFKTSPSIQTSVVEKRYWVDVRGLVRKAGKYLVSEKSSLDEIIAKAGALRGGEGQGQQQAQFVKIEQLGVSATLKLSDYYRGLSDDLLPNWQGGEIVFFQSEGIAGNPVSPVAESNVQLLGQINLPGEYRMKPGSDFLYYIVKAGGPTNQADLENIEIVRIVNAKRKSIVFSLEDVEDIPALQGGDIVLVHPYRENRVISNLSMVITMLTSIALLFIV